MVKHVKKNIPINFKWGYLCILCTKQAKKSVLPPPTKKYYQGVFQPNTIKVKEKPKNNQRFLKDVSEEGKSNFIYFKGAFSIYCK